jgi:hypothetical protein
VKSKSKQKLFLLACMRAGRRHYVTGIRADEGKWTKFKDRARRFTASDAKLAKGRSHAEVVPV